MPGLPLFFNPDPEIPDADLLGFGDLINDDGSSTYLSGDPEMVAGLSPQPMGPPTADGGMPGMGGGLPQTSGLVTSDQTPPIVTSSDGRQFMPNLQTGQFEPLGANGNMQGVQDPQTGELLDPGQPSNILPALGGEIANAAQGYPQPIGNAWEQQMGPGAGGGGLPPTQGLVTADKTPPIVQAADGTQYQPNLQTGQFEPVGAGGAGGGMVPVQREGALPPGMAQQQAQQMGAQNQALFGAEQQGRADENRLYQELVLKQMAANEVERTSRERDVAEEQAKVERWQGEQQALLDSDIETDLIAARGPVGGVMAAIGAALMGAAGNDTGFRMIERSIDQHVRLQVQRRDTKLGILATQIGSSRQAIAMGKAALYKVAADKTELLAAQTKNSVYEAQTPAVLEKLRSKQLEEMQKAERDSLGKTLEKAPVPKPPSAELLQKYGELRRERDASGSLVGRVEQQLGLMWTPGKGGQPGHYANKGEILKKGIQGVGSLEQLAPDLLYSIAGQAAAEGYQVRGAIEALAFAQVRQMQPTGPISNADQKVGAAAAAMRTEEGLLQGLERLRAGEERMQSMDSGEFGPDVVAEFNRRFKASGGRTQQSAPAASRPATAAELQSGARQLRAPAAEQGQPDRGPGNLPPPTPEEFQNAVQGFAEGANLNPDAVLRVINHESGGKPGVTNKLTGKHAGLIQFSQETWQGLAREAGTPDLTWQEMRKMSAEEQLPYVMLYYERLGLGPDNDPGDYAMATFMPAFWKKDDDFVLGKKDSNDKIGGLSMGKVWAQNPGLRNGDTITVGDVRRSVL